MKSNPFSARLHLPVSYQQEEECTPAGCCFSSLRTQVCETGEAPLIRQRFYSEPKERKSKKIDLVIAKKGLSLSKETRGTALPSSSREHSRKEVQLHPKER
jgi:hypothetical protein